MKDKTAQVMTQYRGLRDKRIGQILLEFQTLGVLTVEQMADIRERFTRDRPLKNLDEMLGDTLEKVTAKGYLQ